MVGSKALERCSHGGQIQLGLPPPLQRDLLVVFPQARAASVSEKLRAPSRGSTSLPVLPVLFVCVCVCVRARSARSPALA